MLGNGNSNDTVLKTRKIWFEDKKQDVIHCSAILTVFKTEHPIYLIFNSTVQCQLNKITK